MQWCGERINALAYDRYLPMSVSLVDSPRSTSELAALHPSSLLKSVILAAVGYALIVCAMSTALISSLDRALPAPLRVRLENDAALNLWILAWDVHALVRQPLSVFQANVFYPEPNTLAYSEHQLGLALLFGPLWLITNNPVIAFNTLYLASFVLTGVATFLLVRYWLDDAPAAFIAGLLFAFTPPRLAHHFHTQLLAIWWLPLTMLCLERFLRQPSVMRAGLLAASFTMQWLCSVYLGWLLTVAVAVYVLTGAL